jgi:hypothetical protein
MSDVHMALAREVRQRMIRDGVDPRLVEIKGNNIGRLLETEVKLLIYSEIKRQKLEREISND